MDILYICQNAIGDIITSLPSIHFLKKKCEDISLDICVSESYVDIFLADIHIRSVITVPKEWYEMNTIFPTMNVVSRFTTHYDLVVDSMCIPQTGELIKEIHPERAIGIGFDDVVHVYDNYLPLEQWAAWNNGDRTASYCFADIVQLYTKECSLKDPELYITEEAQEQGREWMEKNNPEQRLVIALNPGAGNEAKRWPMLNFIELARKLKERGFLPLFIFGPKESFLFQRYSENLAKTGSLIFHSEIFSIQPLAGILNQCGLVISNDCAVMHVSAAIRRPTIGIFGPSCSKIWFPYSREKNRVIERNVPCRKNCRGVCSHFSCLTEIQPEEVFQTSLELLDLSIEKDR